MAYVGNTPTTQNFISGTDYFNGTGSQTAFTLSRTVNSVNDIQVTVNNVVQQPNDAYTISGTTLTMTSAPSAGTNNVYVRYLSTTTQVITPSQNTVSWNTLDSNTQQDLGLMYKNKIINGNMVIDQRNAGASVSLSTTTQYPVDRFAAYKGTAGATITAQRSTTVPAGFTNSIIYTVSTGSSPAAGDINAFWQSIEGFNVADLGWGTADAKTITISFWVRSSVTGTYSLSLNNSASNRFYVATYAVNSANTWEQKSVTIAGDTSGTWLKDNGLGVQVTWDLGYGSNFNGTAGAWGSSTIRRTSGSVQLAATTGATFYITGVQLEVGTQATAFSTAGGSYGAELALCQRYFQQWDGSGPVCVAYANSANTNLVAIYPLKVTMRTAPTGITVSSVGAFSIGAIAGTPSAITFSVGNKDTVTILVAMSGTYASLTASQLKCDTSAQISFTGAEL